AGFDAADPYSRPAPAGWRAAIAGRPARFRFAVARAADRRFLGNADAARLYDTAIDRLTAMGGTAVPIDLTPWFEAAGLLYGGPWIAERAAALGTFLTERGDAMLPVTRDIISAGLQMTAVDAFNGQYRLRAFAHQCAALWREVACLVLP